VNELVTCSQDSQLFDISRWVFAVDNYALSSSWAISNILCILRQTQRDDVFSDGAATVVTVEKAGEKLRIRGPTQPRLFAQQIRNF
jgi:hypothetical protein